MKTYGSNSKPNKMLIKINIFFSVNNLCHKNHIQRNILRK